MEIVKLPKEIKLKCECGNENELFTGPFRDMDGKLRDDCLECRVCGALLKLNKDGIFAPSE